MNPYSYSVKKFIPYPMWDVTVVVLYFHEDSNPFFSLYLSLSIYIYINKGKHDLFFFKHR